MPTGAGECDKKNVSLKWLSVRKKKKKKTTQNGNVLNMTWLSWTHHTKVKLNSEDEAEGKKQYN